jgi:hypothetical protein
VPVFPGCHPRAFCAERNKHSVIGCIFYSFFFTS